MRPSVYIVAEMACSHDGDPDRARKIIDGAAHAGANAVQFQLWKRERLVTPQHSANATLSRVALSDADWRALRNHVTRELPHLEVTACVYEPSGLALAQELGVAAIKIHSGDLCDRALVESVARVGKRMHLCVGAAPLAEITRALGWAREAGAGEIWLLDGYQAAPTPPDDVHLEFTRSLEERFGLPIGYQDHSDAESDEAFWLPAAAVGMGVRMLEKHLTDDRSRRGLDHHAALNPVEFTRFVKMVRSVELAFGSTDAVPSSKRRLQYRKSAQKSAVAARDLPKGTRLAADDLLCLRAENGELTPDQIGALIGKHVVADTPAYSPIKREMLE